MEFQTNDFVFAVNPNPVTFTVFSEESGAFTDMIVKYTLNRPLIGGSYFELTLPPPNLDLKLEVGVIPVYTTAVQANYALTLDNVALVLMTDPAGVTTDVANDALF